MRKKIGSLTIFPIQVLGLNLQLCLTIWAKNLVDVELMEFQCLAPMAVPWRRQNWELKT